MGTSLQVAQEALESERDRLTEVVANHKAELSAAESDLARVTSALAALEGEPKGASKQKQKRRKAGKKAPNKQNVVTAIEELLKEDGVVAKDELSELVQTRLAQKGFSRMGFSLRFKEALADQRFIDSPGGIRLKEEEPVSS